MTAYYIKSEADRKLAMARLTSIPADGKWKVSIGKYEKRRDAQNKLNWRWVTAIAEQMYDSKEDIHTDNKLQLGAPILERDNDSFSEAWGMIAANLNHVEQLNAIRFIDVTKIMTVKQMAEYLSDMELHYERNGIMLPKKDDEYFAAMGYFRRVEQ